MEPATRHECATIGVLGLGPMGRPIAENLLERGYVVFGYPRSPAPDLSEARGNSCLGTHHRWAGTCRRVDWVCASHQHPRQRCSPQIHSTRGERPLVVHA